MYKYDNRKKNPENSKYSQLNETVKQWYRALKEMCLKI